MKFKSYEVVPLRDQANPRQCKERNAQFWGLYGIDDKDDAYAVGDFSSREDAEFIRNAIDVSR